MLLPRGGKRRWIVKRFFCDAEGPRSRCRQQHAALHCTADSGSSTLLVETADLLPGVCTNRNTAKRPM